jgi:hypothetical protein
MEFTLNEEMRFFASLRMTESEGFAMTPYACQLIYDVHYNYSMTKKERFKS